MITVAVPVVASESDLSEASTLNCQQEDNS